MRKKLILVGLLLLLIAAVAACGNGGESQASAIPADGNTVVIKDFKFQPAEMTIQKGDTITWINQDSARHNAAGDSFDTGLLGKGESSTLTFDEAGTFDYICTPHPYMKGKVIVE